MLRLWERSEGTGETVEEFAKRVNADLDEIRKIGLVTNYAPLPNGSIYGQVGRQEPIRHPQTGQMMGMNFVDLSADDVAQARANYERAQAARAAAPRVLR